MLIWQGLAVLLIIVVDRLVKSWAVRLAATETAVGIPGIVNIVYAENRGAAFSILQDMRIFFLVLTAIAVGVIFWMLVKRWPRSALGYWALTLLAGGALGNFYDRVVYGYVVDMFELSFMRFAIFNVADIFVSVGGILFCVYLLFVHDKLDAH